jgi:hypothetical protein
MGIVLAILFMAVGVAALVVYGATPHGGPTVSCGPINAFGHSVTVHADCRYVSVTEVAVSAFFLIVAVVAALSARPRT